MCDCASNWLRVNSVISSHDLRVGLLTVHFRVNSIAGGIGQNFQGFLKSLLFRVANICTRRHLLPLLDYNFEEILIPGVNINGAKQLSRFEVIQLTARFE